jgi:hypothetical protein
MKRALPSFKSFRASSGGMGASAVVRTFLPQKPASTSSEKHQNISK